MVTVCNVVVPVPGGTLGCLIAMANKSFSSFCLSASAFFLSCLDSVRRLDNNYRHHDACLMVWDKIAPVNKCWHCYLFGFIVCVVLIDCCRFLQLLNISGVQQLVKHIAKA